MEEKSINKIKYKGTNSQEVSEQLTAQDWLECQGGSYWVLPRLPAGCWVV